MDLPESLTGHMTRKMTCDVDATIGFQSMSCLVGNCAHNCLINDIPLHTEDAEK